MGSYLTSFDKTKIYYDHHKGDNPLTLVFLHGVGGNLTIWQKEMTYFQKKGYSTLAFDFRGHGLSDAPAKFKNYMAAYFAKDLRELLKKHKIKKYALIGHSLGGAIAINYCMTYKTIYPTYLILIETASVCPFDHNRILNLTPFLSKFMRFFAEHSKTHKFSIINHKEYDLSEPENLKNMHLVSYLVHMTPIKSIVEVLDIIENYINCNKKKINYTLKHLKVPTLLLAGEKDQTVPIKLSKDIKAMNKKIKLRILTGADHTVIVSDPKQVITRIQEFIK
ncbi:alpha/beta hydrolase [Candidatus Woesearchaeota archaeon]|nr:alpha/beta hydrolase [Candidatus Woesearchaeota archaeon]